MSTAAGRVLVTPRSLTESGLDGVAELRPLLEAGLELVAGPAGRLPTEQEQIDLLPGCVGWLAGVERIGARALESAPDLRVLSRNGTGTDTVDVAAAERLGVSVRRAAGANAQGVAELTLALTLAALRHVPWSAASVAAGGWQRWRGTELADCVVGVVGAGAIGRRVAGIFGVLGATVLAHDPLVQDGTDDAPLVPLVGLDELVARSDVLTLHRPATADGSPVLGAAELGRVRRGAVLVNTARASLVDDDAVLAVLEDGRLSAYAVDAFDAEPPPPSPLLSHPRVLATPHVGGFTGASVRRATEQAVDGILQVLAERP